MVLDTLYHPPAIEIDRKNGTLRLVHRFEGKPLVKHFIHNTMLGIEFLWGGPVQLETHELAGPSTSDAGGSVSSPHGRTEGDKSEKTWQRVRYTMSERKLSREVI
jgi:stage V sporulation protein R